MSLARAFTKRIKRFEEAASTRVNGINNTRHAGSGIDVSKISSPITLLSTTNVHALNAPDIHKQSPDSANSSATSTHSGHDSDFSTIDRSFLNSSAASTVSSPATPSTPPMESSSGFFDVKSSEAPKLPQRSPSHSKKAHVELSRKLSVQRMSPPPSTLTRAASVHDTATVQTETASHSSHPFGAELAKVNEVAEDFGAASAVMDEEEQFMLNKGLCKFGVQDYINELADMYGGVYEDRLAINPWI